MALLTTWNRGGGFGGSCALLPAGKRFFVADAAKGTGGIKIRCCFYRVRIYEGRSFMRSGHGPFGQMAGRARDSIVSRIISGCEFVCHDTLGYMAGQTAFLLVVTGGFPVDLVCVGPVMGRTFPFVVLCHMTCSAVSSGGADGSLVVYGCQMRKTRASVEENKACKQEK